MILFNELDAHILDVMAKEKEKAKSQLLSVSFADMNFALIVMNGLIVIWINARIILITYSMFTVIKIVA